MIVILWIFYMVSNLWMCYLQPPETLEPIVEGVRVSIRQSPEFCIN